MIISAKKRLKNLLKILKIKFESIQGELVEESNTMCKTIELMRDESLLQGKIYGIIEASRDNGKTDAQIVAYIVAKYTSLSEKDAQKYIDEYSEV